MNHAGELMPDGFPVESITDAGVASPPLHSLAIVGSHPATRELAPYENQNFDIWLFNEAPQKPEIYRRWDACLQIHLPEVYSSPENWVNRDHWAWLQKDHGQGKIIWMQDVDPRVPNSVRYPLEGVLNLVPYRYLRSSPAMALALAIYLGYKSIWLYGSELTSNTEYTYQAVNYAFWIGFAHGRGIDLHLECWHNEFYNQPIYGYEGELQIMPEYYQERIKYHTQELNVYQREYDKLLDQLIDVMLENNYDKVGDIFLRLENAAITAGKSRGALNEAQRYAERNNPISRQEFERVSAQAQLDGRELEKIMNHKAGICEYIWNIWRQTARIDALNQLRQFIKERNQAAYDMGVKLGVFQENMTYMEQYDRLVTAAGGSRAVYQVEKMSHEILS